MQSIATEIVNGLRVTVYYDENGYASNPRDESTLAVIHGDHRNYTIGDGKPPSDEQDALDRGGLRLLVRYLRLCKGAVAIRAVNLYDHSGVSYSTGEVEAAGRHGWDSGTAGYAYVTREAWAETGRTDDPTAPYTRDEGEDKRRFDGLTNAEAAIEWEVKEYGSWANGEVYGYTVVRPHCDNADCPHHEEIDSCWGFIGDPDDAMAEGRAAAS